MILRSETLALENIPVNPYSLMTKTMEYNSTHTTTSGWIQCEKLIEKGSSNCKQRKLTVTVWLETEELGRK